MPTRKYKTNPNQLLAEGQLIVSLEHSFKISTKIFKNTKYYAILFLS